MTTAEANGVTLGVVHFGEAAAPLVLLAGGTTMLSWPDALCEALAREIPRSSGSEQITAPALREKRAPAPRVPLSMQSGTLTRANHRRTPTRGRQRQAIRQ
jgi:hypothetical protein